MHLVCWDWGFEFNHGMMSFLVGGSKSSTRIRKCCQASKPGQKPTAAGFEQHQLADMMYSAGHILPALHSLLADP